MSGQEDMAAALKEANETTNEIATDVEALLAKIAEGGLSKEETAVAIAEVKALGGRLRSVADKY